jgi:hypothetical protein
MWGKQIVSRPAGAPRGRIWWRLVERVEEGSEFVHTEKTTLGADP